MSTRKKTIIALICISLIILSFFGGRSFSKYVSKYTGNGVGEIATWSFKVNGDNTEQIQTINLASTSDNGTLVDYKIAPGTSGSFNIEIDGTGSDVGIDYSVEFEGETETPNNFKYVYNGQKYNHLYEIQNSLNGRIYTDDNNKVRTITIGWIWEYETGDSSEEITSNDQIDTQNSKDISSFSVDIKVIGTQLVPQ